MYRNIAILVIMILISLSINADAGVKITSLDLKTKGTLGYFDINLEGRYQELPDLKVNGKKIQLILSDADYFNSLSKKVNGALLSASYFNNKASVVLELPYEVKPDTIDVEWKNKNIQVVFPRGKVSSSEITRNTISEGSKKESTILEKKENFLTKDKLNEDYLNKLVYEEKSKDNLNRVLDVKTDSVKTQQSVQSKNLNSNSNKLVSNRVNTDGFSFAGYALKFFFFLILVLGIFYGVVQLFKKGIFNKGKLGFLNNSQMIQVLSTTYVGPKRSLMIIKAHKQLFLVANSESGIQFLSEMTDSAGLIKEGERAVTGTNFDLSLSTAEDSQAESPLKVKENINESTPLPEEKGIQALSAKDIVKFSDELKKKARKLRPIEFN
jgi:flagellar biogenesis protein FliO